MTHKRCVACRMSKPDVEFSKGNNKCKVCRKTKVAKKRGLERAQFDEDIEVAAIKKSQRSGHQKHYWLPPGCTKAEHLHNLYYRPIDEAVLLDTVKAALAELRREGGSSGRQVPPDPLGC